MSYTGRLLQLAAFTWKTPIKTYLFLEKHRIGNRLFTHGIRVSACRCLLDKRISRITDGNQLDDHRLFGRFLLSVYPEL